GGEINQSEIRVDRWCLPNSAATVQPRLVVLRPGVVPELSGTRNRVEGPDQMAVSGVERLDASPRAVLAPGEADDDFALVVKRCRRNRVAVLPTLRLNRPDTFTAALIECDELPIQLTDVHPAVADRDAAARPSAADSGDVVRKSGLVVPEHAAALHAQREHIVGARDDVDRPVM